MLSGDFERKLRKVNPHIRIFCSDSDYTPAGIFTVLPNGEYQSICGVDKNMLPEHTIYNPDGSILKSGYRRALKILINRGYIDRRKAERVFSTHLEYKAPTKSKYTPSIASKLAKKGIPVMETA